LKHGSVGDEVFVVVLGWVREKEGGMKGRGERGKREGRRGKGIPERHQIRDHTDSSQSLGQKFVERLLSGNFRLSRFGNPQMHPRLTYPTLISQFLI